MDKEITMDLSSETGIAGGVDRRLERLEREGRWWRALAVGSLALVALAFLMGASGANKAADEVRAKRFIVVDSDGESRGVLHMSDYGSLRLDLYDPDEVLRASLYLGKQGSPALNMFDEKGNMRASLGVRSDGKASLGLYDVEGLRAVLGYTKLEAMGSGKMGERPVSSLVLFDENGSVVWRAP